MTDTSKEIAAAALKLSLTFTLHPDRHVWQEFAELLDPNVWRNNKQWIHDRDQRIKEARRK